MLKVWRELAKQPGLTALTSGIPDPSIASDGILADLANRALERGQAVYQEYGPTAGLLDLREAIAARYRAEGAPVYAEQILVTSGSQQAIAICAQLALRQGRTVVCEVPCYLNVVHAFNALGLKVQTVRRDADGPIMDELVVSGDYDRHLARARRHYRTRRDAVLEGFAEHFGDRATYTVPRGGFHLWCTLAGGGDAVAFACRAAEYGVLITPGPAKDPLERFGDSFHVGYGSTPPERIREAMAILGQRL